jgi:hypothetical protein
MASINCRSNTWPCDDESDLTRMTSIRGENKDAYVRMSGDAGLAYGKFRVKKVTCTTLYVLVESVRVRRLSGIRSRYNYS